jgi:hypothetical protein
MFFRFILFASCPVTLRGLTMSFTLDAMRPFRPTLPTAYPADFVANRVASTPDGNGSIYLYKRARENSMAYQETERRLGIHSHRFDIAGCVVAIVEDVSSAILNGLPLDSYTE